MASDGPMRIQGEGRHRCPVCRRFMWIWEADVVPAVRAERCATCGGVWVTQEQLDQLDESMWVTVEQVPHRVVQSERRLACPRCDGQMDTLSWSDAFPLELDRCRQCRGFWLDSGELEWVRQVVQQKTYEQLDGMEIEQPSSSNHEMTVVQRAYGRGDWGRLVRFFRAFRSRS